MGVTVKAQVPTVRLKKRAVEGRTVIQDIPRQERSEHDLCKHPRPRVLPSASSLQSSSQKRLTNALDGRRSVVFCRFRPFPDSSDERDAREAPSLLM